MFYVDPHYKQPHDVINDLVLTDARGLLKHESGGMILDETVRVGMAARFWAGMYLRCAQGGCCTVPSRACVRASQALTSFLHLINIGHEPEPRFQI